METFVYLGIAVIAGFFFALVLRLIKFAMTVFLGKNINITYIEKSGRDHKKRIYVDKNDELISILKKIKTDNPVHH